MISIKKAKKFKLAGNIILFALFVAAIVFATVKYGREITRLVSSPDEFSRTIKSYGYKSVPIFIMFQVLQVVIAAIPGEVVQIAGGYIFGTFQGTLYLMIGAIIGTIAVFYATRLLGYPLVRVFVSEGKLEKFNFMINSNRTEIIMFVLYLIPGIPKDILTYIAGLTPIKPLRFIITATVARFPALFASAYIGANLYEKDYLSVILLSSAAILLFMAGLLFKDRIIGRVHQLLDRSKS